MTAVRVLGAAEIERALDPDSLVEELARAFVELSAGRVSMPGRIGVEVPHRGTALMMGAHRHGGTTVTAKVVTAYEGLDPTVGPSHRATVLALDALTGTLLMIADGAAITALRTAAGSRLATRLLAHPGAQVLAIVGTGVQAEAHGRALAREREFSELRIAGRRLEAAHDLAARLRTATGQPFTAVASVAKALDGADVVCATTSATTPVIRRDLLADGAHVNSVGFVAEGRELDSATVRDALVFVESRTTALGPPPLGCGDLIGAIEDGVAATDIVHAELGELISGASSGRTRDDQLTLYKSVGVAIEDDAAASLVLAAAREQDIGRTIELD